LPRERVLVGSHKECLLLALFFRAKLVKDGMMSCSKGLRFITENVYPKIQQYSILPLIPVLCSSCYIKKKKKKVNKAPHYPQYYACLYEDLGLENTLS
jgi:hypothetical protein